MTAPSRPDFLDEALDLVPGSALHALRAERPEVKRRTQASAEALFLPAEPDGLSPAERFAAALRVAILNENEALTRAYRARLLATDGGTAMLGIAEAESIGDDGRSAALLRHVDLLSLEPAEARPAHLQALDAAGLSTQAIVTLAQIASFVSYEVRVAFALHLLGAPR